jgi:hypothetical protein
MPVIVGVAAHIFSLPWFNRQQNFIVIYRTKPHICNVYLIKNILPRDILTQPLKAISYDERSEVEYQRY